MIVYFLNKEKNNNININKTDQAITIKSIQDKQAKIEALLRDINNIFDPQSFDPYSENLKSYIDLPIDVGNIGNTHPFGSYELEKKK